MAETAKSAMKRIAMIGIAGAAGSGKDTLGDYIVKNYGFVPRSVASPIKAILTAMFKFPAGAWEDRHWKDSPLPVMGVTPRYLAQTLGTDWGRRMVHEDIWISKLIAGRQPGSKIVVTDIRFPNEAVAIIRSGGLMVRVNRDDVPEVDPHESEDPIDDRLIHFAVDNNGTIEDLQKGFDEAVVEHVEKALKAQEGGS